MIDVKGIELARLQIAKARSAELQRGKWFDWPRQEELWLVCGRPRPLR